LQKNQMGLVSSTMVKFHSGVWPAGAAVGTNTQPESKPPETGSQGSENVDCVTLWFPGAPVNWKVIVVPLVALKLGGMNWKTPPGAVEVEPT
jgi:hypothetical protein